MGEETMAEEAMTEEVAAEHAEEIEGATEEAAEMASEEVTAQAEEAGEAVEEATEQAGHEAAEVVETVETAPAAPSYPADLIIQPIDPATAKQAPVAFSHAKHLATDCAYCHHKGGNVSCTTAGCHTDTTTKKIEPGKTENVSFDAAFHDRKAEKSCVGCHKAQKAGPTSCTDCHPK